MTVKARTSSLSRPLGGVADESRPIGLGFFRCLESCAQTRSFLILTGPGKNHARPEGFQGNVQESRIRVRFPPPFFRERSRLLRSRDCMSPQVLETPLLRGGHLCLHPRDQRALLVAWVEVLGSEGERFLRSCSKTKT